MTFEEYSLDWLRVFKGMRAYNTRRLYKNIIVKHLIPRIGKKEMQDISIMELQSVIIGCRKRKCVGKNKQNFLKIQTSQRYFDCVPYNLVILYFYKMFGGKRNEEK